MRGSYVSVASASVCIAHEIYKVGRQICWIQLAPVRLTLQIVLTLTMKCDKWYRKKNQEGTISEVAEELKISYGLDHYIIHEVLQSWKHST